MGFTLKRQEHGRFHQYNVSLIDSRHREASSSTSGLLSRPQQSDLPLTDRNGRSSRRCLGHEGFHNARCEAIQAFARQ